MLTQKIIITDYAYLITHFLDWPIPATVLLQLASGSGVFPRPVNIFLPFSLFLFSIHGIFALIISDGWFISAGSNIAAHIVSATTSPASDASLLFLLLVPLAFDSQPLGTR